MRSNERARERGRFISSPGSHIRPVYAGELQEDGSLKLVVTEEQDIQEVIESYRMSTELSVILDRFNAGDATALHAYDEIYADISHMPKSMIEAVNKIESYKEVFNNLPIDIKNKFDNNFNIWLAQAGDPGWLAAMQISAVDQSSSAQSEDGAAGVARSGAADGSAVE